MLKFVYEEARHGKHGPIQMITGSSTAKVDGKSEFGQEGA